MSIVGMHIYAYMYAHFFVTFLILWGEVLTFLVSQNFTIFLRQAKDGKICLNLHGTWNCHKNMLKSDHQFGWFQDQALTR